MKRLAFEFITIPIVFLLLWFALSRIHYVEYFKIKEKVEVNEKKLGKLLIEVMVKSENEIEDTVIVNSINKIKDRICEYNNIRKDSIKLRVFEKDEVNAFALPNRNIVVYSELIKKCENSEELACVIAHEMAHIEKNHVTKKFVKEIGIATISSIGGGRNSEILRELLKKTTSTAYDRKLEDEADMTAINYLTNAKINPNHFAEFLNRISEQTDTHSILVFINTHPNSKDRAAKVIKEGVNDKFEETVIMSKESWKEIQSSL